MQPVTTYAVYIVRCSDGTLYTGVTPNLKERLDKHNQGKGAKYTRGRGPVSLVYSESVSDISLALKREMEIRKMSRSQKLKLFE